ncbi:type II toxin-antitoxin system Phd/YefM family antitoxin [Phytoactinopolyspora halotolerans]|uniref:Antitoxin n=1 Tax=Phytoactinopolyspora halotolerans TaxID=1981512 RepID=A0A6L9S2H1_9ACTN|nr:type II toxin-antitoxin system Phd/YefM family antitoxin [Phytoactinopolyspora halotolerans]NED99405.1 type II toxin-antitoxin system Phd/YefM family antitoxin [Phytoactinopolyspora halotolerans]
MDMPKVDHAWSVAEAKARLSEVIDRAEREGPQIISRRGKEAVVVVSIEEWHKKSTRKGTLAEFFAASPLVGSDVVIERARGQMRQVDFDDLDAEEDVESESIGL